MFMPKKAKLLMGAQSALDVADVFSTDLYTGNGSSQTITNGIDLAGEGGLVWAKNRSGTDSHGLLDTLRGGDLLLRTNTTGAETASLGATGISAFNSNGFDLGSYVDLNGSGKTYAAWTYRQSPRFHQVITYTGNGVAGRTISHNLGVTPGMIVVKRRDSASDWQVQHRSVNVNNTIKLNTTDAASANFAFQKTPPTDSEFTVGLLGNTSGATYVAYLFAHDTAGDGIIQCGSYTGNGSTTGPTITLGWEPQYVMITRTDANASWYIYDNQRDPVNPRDNTLSPNLSSAENANSGDLDFNSIGFQLKTTFTDFNASGGSYIYMAIRAEGV